MNSFKKIIEYVRSMYKNKSKKKVIENLCIIIIIGVVLMIAGGSLFKDNTKKSDLQPITKKVSDTKEISKMNDLSNSIEEVLSQVKGAGGVKVLITYYSTAEKVMASDTKKTLNNSTEKDANGGIRESKVEDSDNKICYEDSDSNSKKAIVLKEINPEVKGVVVLADGASNEDVRTNIINAVNVLLDVPIHKITVLTKQ